MQKIEISKDDIILSVSSIKDLQSCWRKYFFRNVELIAPWHTPSPLQVGDAFHRGLQGFYEGRDKKEILRDVREYYKAQEQEYDDEAFVQQCNINSMVTRSMLIGYMFKYQPEEFEGIKPEAEFCICIHDEPGLRVWIVGKRDGLYKKDGKWWLLENKTFSDNDFERYKKKLKLDIQSTLYILASEIELQETIHGVFYNCARKPLIKQRESENDKDFYDRLKLDYVNRSDDFYFKRLWIYRSEDDKQELFREILEIARDLRRKREDQTWYRNTNSCVSYGTCPYLGICTDRPNKDEIGLAFKKVKRFPELELQVLEKEE